MKTNEQDTSEDMAAQLEALDPAVVVDLTRTLGELNAVIAAIPRGHLTRLSLDHPTAVADLKDASIKLGAAIGKVPTIQTSYFRTRGVNEADEVQLAQALRLWAEVLNTIGAQVMAIETIVANLGRSPRTIYDPPRE